MKISNKFSPEVRERAVRLVQEHRGEYIPPAEARQTTIAQSPSRPLLGSNLTQPASTKPGEIQPCEIDDTKAEAKYDNGVLKLKLLKLTSTSSKQIKVSSRGWASNHALDFHAYGFYYYLTPLNLGSRLLT